MKPIMHTSFTVAAFLDSEDDRPVAHAYRKFLRKPEDSLYPYEMFVRVPDHCDFTKTDKPFYDDIFMTAVRRYTAAVNDAQRMALQIYLYIPSHSGTQDRKLLVYGHNEILLAETTNGIRQIAAAYALDDLDMVDADDLADETLERVQKLQSEQIHLTVIPSTASPWVAPDRLKDLYLRGAQVEIHGSGQNAVSNIKFDEDIALHLLEGRQKASIDNMRGFLQGEVGVKLIPAQDNCFTILGEQEKVDIAYHIGKRAVPLIEENRLLTPSWFEAARYDAETTVYQKRAAKILGITRKTRQTAHFDQAATP